MNRKLTALILAAAIVLVLTILAQHREPTCAEIIAHVDRSPTYLPASKQTRERHEECQAASHHSRGES